MLAYHILSDHQAHTLDGTSRQLPLGVYKSPQGHMGTADTCPVEMSAFNGACHKSVCMDFIVQGWSNYPPTN